MYRLILSRAIVGLQSPHKRGDVPYSGMPIPALPPISPQAWGCTRGRMIPTPPASNLPTSVGMYRAQNATLSLDSKSPHKRGDVPKWHDARLEVDGISPQAWGCTDIANRRGMGLANLPTSVGMYRSARTHRPPPHQSPHKRGDVPRLLPVLILFLLISPQAWGCTDSHHRYFSSDRNLPTSVGMYRTIPSRA